MNPEAINALAQLIAAIGVIVSLSYLAAQIRQNMRSMRAGFRSYLENSQPIEDVPRPSQLIHGESSSAASGPT